MCNCEAPEIIIAFEPKNLRLKELFLNAIRPQMIRKQYVVCQQCAQAIEADMMEACAIATKERLSNGK